jgi:hypothetical protein
MTIRTPDTRPRSALSKPTLKRFSWSRWHSDLPLKPEWGLAAAIADVPQHLIEALVGRLEAYASSNTPRGYVGDYNLAALAVTWRCDDATIVAAYEALADDQVGWIAQGHVVDFWQRNPDLHDPTAAERQRRRRARLRAEQEAVDKLWKTVTRDSVTSVTARPQLSEIQNAARKPLNSLSRVTRDSVTVTTRSDQNNKKSEDQKKEHDVIWVVSDGKRIVAERCSVTPSQAWLTITRWRRALRDDHTMLRQILHHADLIAASGGNFVSHVEQEIERMRHEANGPSLPFPPAVVSTGLKGSS